MRGKCSAFLLDNSEETSVRTWRDREPRSYHLLPAWARKPVARMRRRRGSGARAPSPFPLSRFKKEHRDLAQVEVGEGLGLRSKRRREGEAKEQRVRRYSVRAWSETLRDRGRQSTGKGSRESPCGPPPQPRTATRADPRPTHLVRHVAPKVAPHNNVPGGPVLFVNCRGAGKGWVSSGVRGKCRGSAREGRKGARPGKRLPGVSAGAHGESITHTPS